jgi:hypothetical protein
MNGYFRLLTHISAYLRINENIFVIAETITLSSNCFSSTKPEKLSP